MGEHNPYASPNSPPSPIDAVSGKFVCGAKKGPALYIVISAISVTFALALSLQQVMDQLGLNEIEPIGVFFPAIGCIAGAVIYRIRSREWPIDPSAKARVIKYSLIACVTPPGLMFVITGGGRGQGAAMVLICLLNGITALRNWTESN